MLLINSSPGGPDVSVCSRLLSNDFDVGLDHDVGLAAVYRWKVSAYAPCSSTCTAGKLCVSRKLALFQVVDVLSSQLIIYYVSAPPQQNDPEALDASLQYSNDPLETMC